MAKRKDDDTERDESAYEEEFVLSEVVRVWEPPAPEPVPASGPYTAASYIVLRDGNKVAACYPTADQSADQVAARVADALNREHEK